MAVDARTPWGTRMTLQDRAEPSGFTRIGAPVLAAAMRRANEADLAQAERVLERHRR